VDQPGPGTPLSIGIWQLGDALALLRSRSSTTARTPTALSKTQPLWGHDRWMTAVVSAITTMADPRQAERDLRSVNLAPAITTLDRMRAMSNYDPSYSETSRTGPSESSGARTWSVGPLGFRDQLRTARPEPIEGVVVGRRRAQEQDRLGRRSERAGEQVPCGLLAVGAPRDSTWLSAPRLPGAGEAQSTRGPSLSREREPHRAARASHRSGPG